MLWGVLGNGLQELPTRDSGTGTQDFETLPRLLVALFANDWPRQESDRKSAKADAGVYRQLHAYQKPKKISNDNPK